MQGHIDNMTNAQTFILKERLQFHHKPSTSSVLQYRAVIESMDVHPKVLDTSASKHYIKNKLSPKLSACAALSAARSEASSHTDRPIFPFRESTGRDGAFSGADRYLPLILCDLFPQGAWTWPVYRQVNLVWVEEDLCD